MTQYWIDIEWIEVRTQQSCKRFAQITHTHSHALQINSHIKSTNIVFINLNALCNLIILCCIRSYLYSIVNAFNEVEGWVNVTQLLRLYSFYSFSSFFSFCPLLGCRALLRVHVDDLFRITYGVYHQKIKQLVGVFSSLKEQRAHLMMYKLHFVACVPSTRRVRST